MEKKIVRTNILQVRNSLSDQERFDRSHCIWMRMLERDDIRHAQSIGLYASYGSEVRTDEMFQDLSHMGKVVLYPRVLKNHQMEFCRVDSMAELIPGFRGILEPVPEAEVWEEAELLIVPMVAFDSQLMRIGYGGGYYDRYLAAHPNVKTIGVAYECQKVDTVFSEETDKALTYIVTEDEIYE